MRISVIAVSCRIECWRRSSRATLSPKSVDLLAKPVQFALGQHGGAMGGKAFADEIEHSGDIAGFERRRRGSAAAGLSSHCGLLGLSRLDQAGAQAGQRQPVGLLGIAVLEGLDVGVRICHRILSHCDSSGEMSSSREETESWRESSRSETCIFSRASRR